MLAAALGGMSAACGAPSGESEAVGAANAVDGHPNLNGIWQALNTANWDIEAHEARPGPPEFGALFATPAGLGVVVDGPIPYQPWAATKKQENFAKRYTDDPEAKCYLPGIPRATYMPFPFQIVQGTDKIMMVYEYAAAARSIHMDKVPDAPIETWMGHSVGRWEGESLVVDVTKLNGQTWFDRAGNFQSETVKVVERYTPVDANVLNYEVTIEDPKVYTRTWKMQMPLHRRLEKDVQLLDFRCVPFSEDLLYGDLRKVPTRKPAVN
jgi:hypothetical protein